LTFPLCVNSRGGPDCVDLEVGVARGNVVLVEHGSDITWCGGEPEAHPVPAPPAGDPGCPDPVDFGCPDEFAGGDRPAYPPVPVRFRPRLGHAPVTRTAPFPAPADVAAAQGRRLRGAPDRARDRLTDLWRRLRHHELSEVDRRYLATLFGPAALRAVRLDEDPRRAVRALLARFDDLLEHKLARLAELVRRAHAGYVLDAEGDGWEIAQSWGEDEGAAVAAANPAFRGPAVAATRPDPRAALPSVTVTDRYGRTWTPRPDLLDSGPADRHLVGEVDDGADDDGATTLRFGDGTCGAAYPLGGTAHVRYRVGNGPAGNVGREAINRVVFCQTRQDAIRLVRNPLPATGGTAPEPVAEVRDRAPGEARHRLLRAITAADYATLAAGPGIQRAAAEPRWTGSWYEARVAIDPLGADTAPDWLLDEVRHCLHRYRRIGHDLAVVTATLVPLDVALAVEVAPDHLAAGVRAALPRVFRDLFRPDELTFGTPVRASRLVAAAAAVPGVRQVAVTRLRRLFGAAGDALDTGVLPVGALEVAQLDDDPSRPENGRLTLDLRGGR
jgi:predicted phage baseplate assembly protein